MGRKTPPTPRKRVDAFDASAWMAEQLEKYGNRGFQCCICALPDARAAVRAVAELWANGRRGATFRGIARDLLEPRFGMARIGDSTVRRHLMDCEPDLWKKIEARRSAGRSGS